MLFKEFKHTVISITARDNGHDGTDEQIIETILMQIEI